MLAVAVARGIRSLISYTSRYKRSRSAQRRRSVGNPLNGPRADLAPARIAVTAVSAHLRDAGVYLDGLGAVTPLNTVTVTSVSRRGRSWARAPAWSRRPAERCPW